MTLTKEDVAKLLTDPSAETRADAAGKIAASFNQGQLSESERKIAEEIFSLMVKDAEVMVREALARNLKENLEIPHAVVMALAGDVDQVALPVLQYSQVLTDADLVEIIRSQDTEKQLAVAARSEVSEALSDALVETKNEAVVTRLVANDGARISDKTFEAVLDDFGGRETMQGALINRRSLPITIAERLVTMVSEKFKEQLVSKHELPADLASDLVLQSRERATITLSTESDEDSVEKLVFQLNENGRLTPSIVLRAACMGDMRFFEAAMALLVGVPIVNTRNLIHDSGSLGLEGLFERSGLPASHYPAIRAAVDVAKEIEHDGGENDRERYARRMIERILTQYGDLGVDMEADDLEYLLAKMNQLPPDQLGA